MTLIKCRAKKSKDCYDGKACEPIYGEDSMADDGLYDGETVICDACYIAAGSPSSSARTQAGRIAEIDQEMGITSTQIVDLLLVDELMN